MSKRTIIRVDDLKKYYTNKSMYPKGVKRWTVKKIKMPTRNRGSQVLWEKSFKNKKSAESYANCKREGKKKCEKFNYEKHTGFSKPNWGE